MQDLYKYIKEYILGKKIEVLIVFDDMIAYMINNTKLFIRGRKSSMSIVFIIQSNFKVPKDVRSISTFFLSSKFQIKENFNKLL